MPDDNLIILTHKNLLHSIKSSVGSSLFRHLYVKNKQSEVEFDALNDGELSCAYFVSSLLALHGLIDRPHSTVATTIKQIIKAGYTETDTPNQGGIVYWPEHDGHDHIGFYLGPNEFISNDEQTKVPKLHSSTLRDGRQPIKYYTYSALDA